MCSCVLGVLTLGFLLIVAGQQYRYSGYTVHQTVPESFHQLQELLSAIKNIKYDVWRMPQARNDTLDIMVDSQHRPSLLKAFEKFGLASEQVINDVERVFETERRHMHHRRRRATPSLRSYTTTFLSYSEVEQYLREVDHSTSRTPGVQTRAFSIGYTSEERNMTVIKIYKRSRTNKPAILIDGGIHAREWIAPAVVINFIYQLVFNPTDDPEIRFLLEEFDWYLLPLVNPDGYHHSQTAERSWRKTRNINQDSECKGVDANRNFGYYWNPYAGGSTYPCDSVYSGSHPFSVPESYNMASFMRHQQHSLKAYLTLHSYGQYFLYPYGYSSDAVASDWQDLESLARIAVRAMRRSYTVGASGKDLYPAAGGSDDYAKGACSIKYSYTVELPPRERGGGYSGFVMSPSQIPSIAADTINGIKALAFELSRRLLTSV